jgi:hypothetical protein
MIKKIGFFIFLISSTYSFGQIVNQPMDSLQISADSLKMEAIPVELEDTLSYAEEYRRDAFQFNWGIRGGQSLKVESILPRVQLLEFLPVVHLCFQMEEL